MTTRLNTADIAAMHNKDEAHDALKEKFLSKSEERRVNFQRNAHFKPASEKQISFLRSLVAERLPDTTEDYIQSVIDQGSHRVSKAIEKLLTLPKHTTTYVSPSERRSNAYPGKCEDCGEEVSPQDGYLSKADSGKWEVTHNECPPPLFSFPYGRYAVDNMEGDLRFYMASRDGLYVQAGDDYHLIHEDSPHYNYTINGIEADPKAAAMRYGQELGICGRCSRTLTDETSRSMGIGPVCAEKGW